MIFLHIDPSTNNTSLLDKYIEEGKDIFVLVYMEGCGPCNATRPEWEKIKKKYKSNNDGNDDDNIVIADVSQECLNDIKTITPDIAGFPTMLFISNGGKVLENYEDSSIKDKDRSVDSFIEWIETKGNKINSNSNSSQKGGKIRIRRRIRKTRKIGRNNRSISKNSRKGRKWSMKYKKSINCNRPKGFSQKQHCKYGRSKYHNRKR
jgi:hypothetical protein